MSNIQPIRADVEPVFDVGREMVQFVAERINEYIANHGEPPVSIAFALIGPDKGASVSEAWSWSPGDEDRSQLQCCASASALLMKRALNI